MLKRNVALTAACTVALSGILPIGTVTGATTAKDIIRTEENSNAARLEVGRFTTPSSQSAEKIVQRYLQSQRNTYQFAGTAASDFTVLQSIALKGTDKQVVRLQQKYKGIPVHGYTQFVHVDGKGIITGIAGAVAPSAGWSVSTAPKQTMKQAIAAAEKDAALQNVTSKAELVIYYDKTKPVLAYAVNVTGHNTAPARLRYFIDAVSGQVVEKINMLTYKSEAVTGTGTGVLGDKKKLQLTKRFSRYYMQDMTRGQGLYTYDGQLGLLQIPIKLYYGTKPAFHSSYDRAAVDAHAYMGASYDYFTKVLGDPSFDYVAEGDASLRAIVHFGTDFNNAFWDGTSIVFGDGDGEMFTSLSGALDVVGHEITHAVTERLVGLIPEGETGALNEALADFFGTMIEFQSGKNPDWEMGEDVYTPDVRNDALRSLADPEKYGAPSHYFQRYLGYEDDGGVHINSGIVSKAMYLISEGGTQRDIKVKGIGKEKAMTLIYNSLFYLMGDADFLDFRNAVTQAAIDLYGDTSSELKAVKRAFNAVGVQGPNDVETLTVHGTLSGKTEEPSEVQWYAINANSAAKEGSHLQIRLTGTPGIVTVFKNRQQAEESAPYSQYEAAPDETGNAVVDFPIAWKDKYYVKVQFQEAGSYELSADVVTKEPVAQEEPCIIEEAATEVTSYQGVLPTMRTFRDNILANTEDGRLITNTYYETSKQLIDDFITDSSFRNEALSYAGQLQPLLKGFTSADKGLDRKVTAKEWNAITGLKHAVSTRVSEKTREKIDRIWAALKVDELQTKTAYQWAKERGWIEPHVEILYKAKSTTAKAKAAQAVKSQAVKKPAAADKLPDTFKVTVAASKAEATIKKLSSVKGVTAVTENKQYKVTAKDVQYNHQWSLHNTGQTDGAEGADIDYERMNKLLKGKPQAPMTVAVIDTGVAYDLADLKDRVFTDGDYDFVNEDDDAYDDHSHGTHVAGVIAAASNNSYSMTGISAKAMILPLKALDVMGSGTTEGIAAAIRYAADQKVKVISMSLGGPEDDPLMEDAMAYAAGKGVTIIAASGNEGAEGISYPARSKYVISVGATDASDELASFSNFGEGLDIVAPGVDIPSLVPSGEVQLMSGTSMATPHVSAVAAVLYGLKPGLTREEVERLLTTGDDLGEPGYDIMTGYGRLNAAKAVEALLQK